MVNTKKVLQAIAPLRSEADEEGERADTKKSKRALSTKHRKKSAAVENIRKLFKKRPDLLDILLAGIAKAVSKKR